MRKSNADTTWFEYRKHWEIGDTDRANAIYKAGANGDVEEEEQHLFMQEVGIKKTHKFLDIGCGCLRGTKRVAELLGPNFYGIDISEGMIKQAKAVAPQANLVNNLDFDIKKYFPGVKFDFILSVSLLTHLFPDDVEDLFDNVSKVLKGEYYFTIYPGQNSGDIGLHYYDIEWIKNTGKKYGLLITEMDGEYHRKRDYNIIDKYNSRLGQFALKATKIKGNGRHNLQ
jgi:SAM-dependent methyltransferase